MNSLLLVLVTLVLILQLVGCFSASKKHPHSGVLEPFKEDMKFGEITSSQELCLERGEPVLVNERSGSDGFGLVVQDINGTHDRCLSAVYDVESYPRMVPCVKSVDTYEKFTAMNGVELKKSQFIVGVLGFKFGYFLKLTKNPKKSIVSWTLDYERESDFDDNVGLWKISPHPKKDGWSRVMYSTRLKLPPWAPSVVVNFLTSRALKDSTAWLKKEIESKPSK